VRIKEIREWYILVIWGMFPLREVAAVCLYTSIPFIRQKFQVSQVITSDMSP
jgi:hypothetical protein